MAHQGRQLQAAEQALISISMSTTSMRMHHGRCMVLLLLLLLSRHAHVWELHDAKAMVW